MGQAMLVIFSVRSLETRLASASAAVSAAISTVLRAREHGHA
jgi:hypothetical protein